MGARPRRWAGGPRAGRRGVVDFDSEITLLTVRSAAADGSTRTSFCAPVGHRQVDGDHVESWQPHPMSTAALARAQQVAAAVTGDLGGHGVFGVELFLRGDDVWFSEVSPRPHDTGMMTLVTQHQSQFDLHARALLGLPVDTSLRGAGASAVVHGGVEGPGVVFDGVDAALEVPGSELRLFGKPVSHPRRRLGVALARALDGEGAGDVEDLRARAREVASRVVPRLPED